MGTAASAMRAGSYAAAAAPSGGFLHVDLKYHSVAARGPLAAAAPNAAPTPEPSPSLSTVADIVSWISVLGPVASAMMPWLYNVHTGNIKKTAKLFSTPAFVTSAYSAVLWLFYNAAVIKKDKTLDLVVSCASVASVAANFVMSVYAQRGERKKGYIVGGSILACFGGVFAMTRWDETPSEGIVYTFGCLAILLLIVCLIQQFADIVMHSSRKAERIVIALNLLPSLMQNLGVYIVTYKYTPEQNFVLVSSGIGAISNFLFLFIPFLISAFGRFMPKFMRRMCHFEDEGLKRKRSLRLSCARPYKKTRPCVQSTHRSIQTSRSDKVKKNIRQPTEGSEKLEIIVIKGTDQEAGRTRNGNRSRIGLKKWFQCFGSKTD